LAASIDNVSESGNLGFSIERQDDDLAPVARAVSALSERTVNAMRNTEQSAREVALGVSQLRKSAGKLTELSTKHQSVLNVALDRLTQSVNALDHIEQASERTKPTLIAVSDQSFASVQAAKETVDSLNAAREQVRQSEKRVKGLGERVQEIRQTVRTVADLSDRTGILALNASLQAAAAGPAGREFAALADEVKRLSDSGGAATEQIGQLVSAIHSESAQALSAINVAIEKTVMASQRASDSRASVMKTHTELDKVLQDIGELTQVIDRQAGAADALAKQVDRVDRYNDQLRELINAHSVSTGSVSKQAERLLVSASSTNESAS
jgi:methyl-accepting chemotaxis protein